MRTRIKASHGWAALAIYVTIYELVAPEGELLSEMVDRTLVSHPWITRSVIAVTALHLLNVLDERVDPYAYIAKSARWRVGPNITV